MRDEVDTFAVARVARRVLDLDQLLVDADCEYDSQKWIREVNKGTKILVLHAEDDDTVPFKLGEFQKRMLVSKEPSYGPLQLPSKYGMPQKQSKQLHFSKEKSEGFDSCLN